MAGNLFSVKGSTWSRTALYFESSAIGGGSGCRWLRKQAGSEWRSRGCWCRSIGEGGAANRGCGAALSGGGSVPAPALIYEGRRRSATVAAKAAAVRPDVEEEATTAIPHWGIVRRERERERKRNEIQLLAGLESKAAVGANS